MKKVKMNLVGLDGNAFSLLGAFYKNAQGQGWSTSEIDKVIAECMKGNYNHLLDTLIDNTEEIEND